MPSAIVSGLTEATFEHSTTTARSMSISLEHFASPSTLPSFLLATARSTCYHDWLGGRVHWRGHDLKGKHQEPWPHLCLVMSEAACPLTTTVSASSQQHTRSLRVLRLIRGARHCMAVSCTLLGDKRPDDKESARPAVI